MWVERQPEPITVLSDAWDIMGMYSIHPREKPKYRRKNSNTVKNHIAEKPKVALIPSWRL